ncbi:hypothetical protein [Candidatus Poriferisocius sp.]|uniref:hypothetical protein n=1 Tax=Candidatus Poriferisocius sp. TaxID=3101276 RepID=UPI003B021FDC
MDEVARQDSLEEHQYAQPAELPKVPPHLRPLEEKQAAFDEFERTFPFDRFPTGSLTSLLEEEREALRHIYPNSLVDLGRQGIIKMRVFREDGSSYFLPEDEEAET